MELRLMIDDGCSGRHWDGKSTKAMSLEFGRQYRIDTQGGGWGILYCGMHRVIRVEYSAESWKAEMFTAFPLRTCVRCSVFDSK